MVYTCDSKSHAARLMGSSPISGTMKKPKVIAVVGPTASGKTSLSIEIANRYSGEIISADSRQIYRGLDIGTGKVSDKEMQGVEHHLLDIVNVTESYNATDFVHDADLAISRIIKRGNLPVVAGGTFFYLDQLRRKISAPAVAPNQKLRNELEELDVETLLAKLKNLDAERASVIDPQNKRRIIRSLEIVDSLGKVPPTQQSESPYDWLIIGISVEKETLRKKFKKRLLGWMENGLIEEAEKVNQMNLTEKQFSELGFEYTLTRDFVDKKFDKETFIQRFIEKNWQYAKRQLTWLKRDKDILWFEPKQQDEVFQAIDSFLGK